MNGVMASALTVDPLILSDTDIPLLGKGSEAIEALTKVILDKRWLESLVFYVWFKYAILFYNR